jgi:hypothetical protein
MTDNPPLSREAVEALLTNSDPWLSCDECFEHHDAVVEGLLASHAPVDERFRVHFNACGACLEEARSLASLVAEDLGLDPGEAVRRFDDALLRPPV